MKGQRGTRCEEEAGGDRRGWDTSTQAGGRFKERNAWSHLPPLNQMEEDRGGRWKSVGGLTQCQSHILETAQFKPKLPP